MMSKKGHEDIEQTQLPISCCSSTWFHLLHHKKLTMATTGPEFMYFTSPGKNGRSFRSM